jgi:hypothetical protein
MIIGKDIYENPVIAGFMALLFREHGIRHGRAPFEPFGFELLQQTPLDQTLGDVLIAQARLVRLIEFKRRRNKSRKERVKLAVLMTALEGAGNVPLVAVSREVHWYVQTDFTMKPNSVVVPYLDLECPSGDRDLERFVQEIGDAMDGPGMRDEELDSLRLYVQALAVCAGDNEAEAGSGGLIIASGSGGATQLYPIHDVRQLAMTPREVFREFELRLEQAQKPELRPELRPERRLDRDLGMRREGPDRDHHMKWEGPSLGR